MIVLAEDKVADFKIHGLSTAIQQIPRLWWAVQQLRQRMGLNGLQQPRFCHCLTGQIFHFLSPVTRKAAGG